MKHANIVWFEIPVKNLDRAITFYSQLLGITITRHKLYQTEYGIFDKKNTGISGSLKVDENKVGKGVNLFFFVNVLSDAIDIALACGGKIVLEKALLKQVDAHGKTVLAHNMIDNQVGYYAEILDSEGNQISLYSHY
ncbi:MAG TPA: VOC family protein [Bacteroidia bacterium]|nr:VOC family protein [Bacteroidia bacterium]